MAYLLPAASYQAPPRPVRGSQLNTIIEDHEQTNFGHTSGSGTDTDEGTVIGRPAGLDAKFFIAAPKKSRLANTTFPPSPYSDGSSPSSAKTSDQPSVEFDDLYDASDNETQFSDSCPSLRDSVSSDPTSFATDSNRNSSSSSRSGRNRYPSITIPPTNPWASLLSPMKASPVPPTPPAKIPISPAVLSRIALWAPAPNAPPSLGSASSATSDQRSNLSAPVTPEMHNIAEGQAWGGNSQVRLRPEPDSAHDETSSDGMSPQEEVLIENPEDWSEIMGHFPRIPGATPLDGSPLPPDLDDFPLPANMAPSDTGVLLPAEALRTLNHLVPDRSPDLRSDASLQDQREKEMKERSDPPSRPRSLDGVTPLGSDYSDYSFSKLSIPSPGGFFSSLRAGTRHTWCNGLPTLSNPPSSATAENFYNVLWQEPGRIVERVLEIDDNLTDGPPTARQPIFSHPDTARRDTFPADAPDLHDSPTSPARTVQDLPRTQEIRYEYEEAYENELLETAAENFDRTSVWLAAQSTYMSALRETNPLNDMDKDWIQEKRLSAHGKNDSLDSPMKKAVRFLEEAIITTDEPANTEGDQKEPIFHQAFRHMLHSRKRRDAFVHATARIDAVQSLRVALKDMHIDQLLGKYEIREPERPKYSGPFSQNPRQTGVFELTPAQIAFHKVEREKAALDQISTTAWVVDALKYLNDNRLLACPGASQRLDSAALPLTDPKCLGSKRFRVLDLGGNTSCDWAWHCAEKWPNVKVYTVVTKSQTSTTHLKGPPNHRQVSVPHVWQLPFRDAHFDVISARSLHAMLKHEPVPGQTQIDEYDLCLKECMRVLKPGGYLEYLLMDASIAHAGPLGSAMSVEFGFNLKTRGYDAVPTKVFLRRLRKSGFVGLKRAWMFLPMGSVRPESGGKKVREAPEPEVKSLCEGDVEAVLGPVGSTGDVADVSGLLGGWMWEQWMLKLQMEMGREKGKLLEGVAAVLEEGRGVGSGWRALSGWARKPRDKSVKGTIRIKIDGLAGA
jgi:SAM-dependent methyltransferase